ncbi:MAG TPA: hypothetical protein VFS37_11965 [Conexibacter sp.]|nr:hypothetical protein [Conexibacter sp.]
MSGNAYKALGFVVWRGGMWYLRRRYGVARRVGTGLLAASAVAAAGALAARRRNGHA